MFSPNNANSRQTYELEGPAEIAAGMVLFWIWRRVRAGPSQRFGAAVTTFGAEVENSIGGFDEVEVVFDDQKRVAPWRSHSSA